MRGLVGNCKLRFQIGQLLLVTGILLHKRTSLVL